MTHIYESVEPARADIDARPDPLVLEFGTSWCGFCLAAQPLIASAFAAHPGLAHLKIEDGKGRPLGRSFKVKLWPTLIVVHRGREVARVVRPESAEEIGVALARASVD